VAGDETAIAVDTSGPDTAAQEYASSGETDPAPEASDSTVSSGDSTDESAEQAGSSEGPAEAGDTKEEGSQEA